MRRLFYGLALFLLLTSILRPAPAVQAETRFQSSEAQGLLASMTPEERVGQLFLVTFQGTDTHDQTEIYDLIANHHIGGVVLLASNDNFLPQPDTISAAHQIINSLQRIEADATPSTADANAQPNDKTYVPLFIGVAAHYSRLQYFDVESRGIPYLEFEIGLAPAF